MRYILKQLWGIFLFVPVIAYPQIRVTFILDSSSTFSAGNVFAAGNFNAWRPGDTAFKFVNRKLAIELPGPTTVEFKLTKGSWQRVETNKQGADIKNRVFFPGSDTTITLLVEGFKQDTNTNRPHTASKNVLLPEKEFYIPQLNRTRRLRLYLPPDYTTSLKRYPVLYITDGQNCFDDYSSAFGEWQVDETLDKFYDSCGKSMIVVAVDNGGALRMSEYQPYIQENIQAEGKQYAAFITETLKPFIDSNYRTLQLPHDTHVAGSSLGAHISMYISSKYPGVFGNAGIFSPAFWTGRSIYTDVQNALPAFANHSFFFYAGGKESSQMVPDITAMYQIIKNQPVLKAMLQIDQEAGHNESAWKKWFPAYLNFIFQEQ